MTIITPSNWLRNLVKHSFLREYQCKVINNGIDMSQFYPIKSDFRKKHGIQDKFMVLGVATAWDEMKGYSDYIKVANRLGEKYKVVLVGLTKEQLQKLPMNVLGIERTSSISELAQIYTAADLFLNLSYCENYPTVNIEAMACGTPVLTYKTGGSPEIVEEYKGYVIEQGNVNAVVEKIRGLKQSELVNPIIDRKKMDNAEATINYMKLYDGKSNE